MSLREGTSEKPTGNTLAELESKWKELDTKISFRNSIKSNSVSERIEGEHENGVYVPVEGDNNHQDGRGRRRNTEYYSDGDVKENGSWYLKAVVANRRSKGDREGGFGTNLETLSETGSTILRGGDINRVSFTSSIPLLSPVSSIVPEDTHRGRNNVVPVVSSREFGRVASDALLGVGLHAMGLSPDKDQLEHEIGTLTESKMAIMGDIESSRKKLDKLVDQKVKSEQELSSLMSEFQHARIALENLQNDFENEKKVIEEKREELVSDLNANLEMKKSEFLSQQKEAEKALEERRRQNEALSRSLEEKECLFDQKVKEFEVQKSQLCSDVRSFNKRYDKITGRLQEREQQLSEREEEFRGKISKAEELIKMENLLKDKESFVNNMESDLHKRIVDCEEKSASTEKARRRLEEELATLQADKEEFENRKHAELEDLKKEKASLGKWESTLQETSREIQVEKEKLQSLRLEEKEAKVEIALLEDKLDAAKKELESVQNTLALEEQRMAVLAEQKKDLERMESDILAREESVREASDQLERDKELYESKLLEVRTLEEDLIERRRIIEQGEEKMRIGLEELEAKQSRIANDSESLSSMMEKMETESMLLQERLSAIVQKENDFEAHKLSWEAESSKEIKERELLLEDMETTLEKRREMLDVQEAEFQHLSRALKSQLEEREQQLLDDNSRLQEQKAAFQERERKMLENLLDREKNVAEREQDADALTRALADKESELHAKSLEFQLKEETLHAETEKAIQMQDEATKVSQKASILVKEAEMDREYLESRERRVKALESEMESLRHKLTDQSAELVAATEAALQRESAAALQIKEADFKMGEVVQLRKRHEEEFTKWEKEIADSHKKADAAREMVESMKNEQLILQAKNKMLQGIENNLREREWKLQDSWNLVKAEASKLLESCSGELSPVGTFSFLDLEDSSPSEVSFLEKSIDNSRVSLDPSPRDSGLSFNESLEHSYQIWHDVSRRETRLQRWAIALSLEHSRVKRLSERASCLQRQHEEGMSKAAQDRITAEKLLKEIQEREVELEHAALELETKEKKMQHERRKLAEDKEDAKASEEEIGLKSKEVEARSKALSSLEVTWKERMNELRDRERLVNESHKRLSQQREALEEREVRVLEDEAKLRDELASLSARRSTLQNLEHALLTKESELKDREQDSDALLIAARKERDATALAVTESRNRLSVIEERSAELEALSEHVNQSMNRLNEIEDHDNFLRELSETLASKERELSKREDILGQEANDLATILTELEEKEEQLSAQEDYLEEKSQEIENRLDDLRKKEEKVSQQSKENEDLQRTLQIEKNALDAERRLLSTEQDALQSKMKDLEEREIRASIICEREHELDAREQKVIAGESLETDKDLRRKHLDVLTEKLAARECKVRQQERENQLLSINLKKEKARLLEEQKRLFHEATTLEQQRQHEKDAYARKRSMLTTMEEAFDMKREQLLLAAKEIQIAMEKSKATNEEAIQFQRRLLEEKKFQDGQILDLHMKELSLEQQQAELQHAQELLNCKEQVLIQRENDTRILEEKIDGLKEMLEMRDRRYNCLPKNHESPLSEDHYDLPAKNSSERLNRLENLVKRVGKKELIDRAARLREQLEAMHLQQQETDCECPSPLSFSFLTSDEEDSDQETITLKRRDETVYATNAAMTAWESDMGRLLEDILLILRQEASAMHHSTTMIPTRS